MRFRDFMPFRPQEQEQTHTRNGPALYNYENYVASQTNNYALQLTENQALAIAAFDRGVQLIADTISNFPLQRYVNGQKAELTPLLAAPYPRETRKDTLYGMLVDYVLYGNTFAVLTEFDELGYAGSMIPVPTSSVTVRQLESGAIEYQIGTQKFEQWEILHIKGFHRSGEIIGIGALQRAAKSISHADIQNRHSYNALAEGAVPPIAIQFNQVMSPDEKKEYHASWVKRHSNSGLPAILDGGATVKEYGFNNMEQQLLEARMFSIKEIANHLNLDAYWLGNDVGNSNSYSNVEQKAQHLVNFSLSGVMQRFEQSFGRILPPGEEARWNYDALLRPLTTERYQAHATAISAGFMLVDEVRAIEDLPPLPEQPEPEQEEEEQPPTQEEETEDDE